MGTRRIKEELTKSMKLPVGYGLTFASNIDTTKPREKELLVTAVRLGGFYDNIIMEELQTEHYDAFIVFLVPQRLPVLFLEYHCVLPPGDSKACMGQGHAIVILDIMQRNMAFFGVSGLVARCFARWLLTVADTGHACIMLEVFTGRDLRASYPRSRDSRRLTSTKLLAYYRSFGFVENQNLVRYLGIGSRDYTYPVFFLPAYYIQEHRSQYTLQTDESTQRCRVCSTRGLRSRVSLATGQLIEEEMCWSNVDTERALARLPCCSSLLRNKQKKKPKQTNTGVIGGGARVIITAGNNGNNHLQTVTAITNKQR